MFKQCMLRVIQYFLRNLCVQRVPTAYPTAFPTAFQTALQVCVQVTCLGFSSAELSATFRGLLPLPFPLPLKPNLSKRPKSPTITEICLTTKCKSLKLVWNVMSKSFRPSLPKEEYCSSPKRTCFLPLWKFACLQMMILDDNFIQFQENP